MSTVTKKKHIKQQSSAEMVEQLLTNVTNKYIQIHTLYIVVLFLFLFFFQLRSTNVEEREEACRTFTMILLDEPMTASIPGSHMCSAELITGYGERLIPLLLENFSGVGSALGTMGRDTRAKREDVKLALSLLTSASEALKNLCSKGGVLICQRLTNSHNGVKVIFDLINTLSGLNTAAGGDDDDDDDIVEDVVGVLIQLILVLTELAENCEKSLELITKSGVAFKFLDLIFSTAEAPAATAAAIGSSTGGGDPWAGLVRGSKDIKVVICKFLGTITDNNPTLAKLIVEHSGPGVFRSTILTKLSALFARLGTDENITAALFTDPNNSNSSSSTATTTTADTIPDLEVLALMAAFSYNILRNYYVPDTAAAAASSEAVELVNAFVPLFTRILSLSPAALLRTVVEPRMTALDTAETTTTATITATITAAEKGIGKGEEMEDMEEMEEEAETDEHFAEKLDVLLRWKQVGAAQQVLLETLTNICFCEGEAEDDIDMNSNNNNDDDDDDLADVSDVAQPSAALAAEAAPTIVAIERSGVLDAVTRRAADGTEAALEFIGRHQWAEPHVSVLFTVQSRALACLNNVIISNGTIANTEALWHFAEAITLTALKMCEGCCNSNSNSNSSNSSSSSDDEDLFKIGVDLLEESTSILDSVARRFFRPEDIAKLTWRPALDSLLRVAQAGLSDSAALHAVGAIGFVGALYTSSVLETETIINALLVIVMDEASNIELVCAAVNAVIDLFAEKPASPAMFPSHAKIITAFSQILPSFRRRTALEKKKGDKSLFLRLDETRINMARLIKYKSAQNLTSF